MTEKFGIKEIQFLDDNVTLRREHIESICNLIISENINIAFCTPNGVRADTIDDGLAKLMKKAEWYATGLGIESGNETVLKNIKKSETLAEIKNAISILRKNHIKVSGLFILGLPGDTKETMQETIDFALSSKLDAAIFSIFSVIPGSDYWNELYGTFQPDFSKSDFSNPVWTTEGITADELKAIHRNATRRAYLQPRRIFRYILGLNPGNLVTNLKLTVPSVLSLMFPRLRKRNTTV